MRSAVAQSRRLKGLGAAQSGHVEGAQSLLDVLTDAAEFADVEVGSGGVAGRDAQLTSA
jgi:hypothetical protein